MLKKPTWKEQAQGLKALGKRINLESDGCSNAPDLNFRGCCNEHDYYYRNSEEWTGVSRAEADKRLRKCIQRKWKLFFTPWIYWGAVRMFGWMPWRKKGENKRKETS